MKLKLLILIIIAALWLAACGEATVSVTNKSYEPKLTIEAFLIAGKKPQQIRISRNFPVDARQDQIDLILEDADVVITDEESGTEYPLTFMSLGTSPDSNWFDYTGNDLIIRSGKTYRLDVSAEVGGKMLHAGAVTTVPGTGFKIAGINYTELRYRQTDDSGNLMRFFMTIRRSPGTTFYVATIRALDGNRDSFIFNNPFFNPDHHDLDELIDRLRYRVQWIQDTPLSAGETEIEIYWSQLWFYSDYEIIAYAADKNYKDFLQTFNRVQEQDGNFHEAEFHIEGDGIGVFGSMIADTISIRVTK